MPYVLLLLSWASPLLPNAQSRLSQFPEGNIGQRQDILALLDASDFLEQQALRGVPIVTRVRSSAVDLEYAMDTHGNFTHYEDQAAFGDRPFFFIAFNTKWENIRDPAFYALLDTCPEQQQIGPYRIASCFPLHPASVP